MNLLLKNILYFIGGIVILLFLLLLLITLFGDNYVGSSLKDQVRESTDSTYNLSFEDLSINVFSGSASISKARIQADTAAFSTPSSTENPHRILIQGSFDKINIEGLNIFSLLMGDELRINTIRISQPDISVLKNPHDSEVSKDNSQSSSIDSAILAVIPRRYRALEMGEFVIQEGYGIFSHAGDTLLSLRQLDLSLRNIRVDSASAHSARTFITENISVDAGNFMMKLSDSLNIIRFDRLSVYSDQKTVALDSFQLIPRYGEKEFARRHGSTIDRIDLTIPSMRFENVDFSRYVDSAAVYVSYVQINNLKLEDYFNRDIPAGSTSPKPLPFMAFRDIKIPVKIDSLQIENAYISYSEYLGNFTKAGTITFEEIDAIFRNISNYPEDVEEGIITTLDAKSRVMGTGLLEAQFEFPMDTPNGFHEVKGKLHQMPMPHFNRVMEHMASIRIDKGRINSLTFAMTLDNQQSGGTLVMNYEDLSISVLDKLTMEGDGLLENLKSLLANNFLVRNQNTPEDNRQAVPIKFERDKSKSIFNYWWKSLLSGIKESIQV